MHHVDVIRIPSSSPGDISGLEALIACGQVAAHDIVAIMGKTEGNGCVNDYTREFATRMLAACLGRHLDLAPEAVEKRVAFVMSGGTEGVLSPHHTMFARRPAQGAPLAGANRLTLGIAVTR
ncbi:MAG: ring-opening amidohydrolase, partial [Comamonas sp.]